jgi:hypothetical protein
LFTGKVLEEFSQTLESAREGGEKKAALGDMRNDFGRMRRCSVEGWKSI